ncbi:MAG: hypothetical protein OHK0046_43850 [Anaerolineae bacterium]
MLSKSLKAVLIVVMVVLLVGGAALAQDAPLVVVSWNVESGNADSDVIAERLAEFEDVDLWGLSEVTDQDIEDYEAASEEGENANFESLLGSTGGGDRLAILYDEGRLELVDDYELDEINYLGRVRAPLVGHFRDRDTGQEFLFMVNHLYRGNATGRHEQARLLNNWAEMQSLPVIAVGDYNFDYDPETEARDLGFDVMVADGVYEWVRPAVLISTQCSSTNNSPCRFNSVLDFVFVSGIARDWVAESEIIADVFPPADEASDHRPVWATFTFVVDVVTPTPVVPEGEAVTRTMILERIAQLEAELQALRALVEQLPE